MTSNDLDMMIDFFLSNFTVHLRRDCADISGMRGYRQIEYRHLDMKVPSMRFICFTPSIVTTLHPAFFSNSEKDNLTLNSSPLVGALRPAYISTAFLGYWGLVLPHNPNKV